MPLISVCGTLSMVHSLIKSKTGCEQGLRAMMKGRVSVAAPHILLNFLIVFHWIEYVGQQLK